MKQQFNKIKYILSCYDPRKFKRTNDKAINVKRLKQWNNL